MNDTKEVGTKRNRRKTTWQMNILFQPVTGCSRWAKQCIRQMGVHDNVDEFSNETEVTPLLYASLGVLK